MKPGYKTTEFWLSAVTTLIGLLMTSGVIMPGSTWDKAIGLGMAALATMGYTASRGNVKASAADPGTSYPADPKQ